ncbi:MAG: SGNH/GDSL hydrolase family protein [Pirellulales bacterium]
MSTRLLFNRVVVCCAIGLSILSHGSTWADEPAADAPASPTLLFLGDSITRGGGYVRLIGEELSRRHPGNPPKVVNQGRSSETVSNLSEAYHPGRRPCLFTRLDAELAANKPDWVVACYGINDGIYHPFNEERFTAYQAGIESLIKKAHDSGARVILLTPPPFARTGPFPEGADAAAKQEIVAKANAAAEIKADKDPNTFGYRTPYAYYDEVMARYAEWLLTLNDRDNVWVVDVRTPMLARLAETHGGDPIHPNATGHDIMAAAFLKRWPAIEGATKK